jgi:hypothetical protein
MSNGERLPCPPFHNCHYVTARSELVPIAERLANERVSNDTEHGSLWTRVFNAEMDRLAQALLNGSART